MEQLKKLITAKRDIKSSTLNIYARNIRSLNSIITGKDEFTSLAFLHDYNKVRTTLLERLKNPQVRFGLSTLKNYIASVLVFLKSEINDYDNYYDVEPEEQKVLDAKNPTITQTPDY